MNHYNETSRMLKKFNYYTTILMIIWVVTPYCERNISPFIIVFLMIFWIFLSSIIRIRTKKIIGKNDIKLFSNVIIWISLIFAYRLIGISSAAWGNYYKQLLFFLFIFIGYFYVEFMGETYCKKILQVIFLVSMTNIAQNIYLLWVYPNASVELNFSALYKTTNVGGTMLSFYTVLMSALILILYKNKVKTSLVHIMSLILCAIYIFSAARATSVILFVITILLLGYYKFISLRPKRERILYCILVILLCFLAWVFLPRFLEIIAIQLDNNRLSDRIYAVANLSSGNLTDGDITVTGRTEMYLLSINTFLKNIKNFIFGVGYHTTENITDFWYYFTGVGGHSEFLDLPARYGLVGVILVANILRLFYKRIRRYKNVNCYYGAKVIFMVFIYYSFVNNSFDPSIGMLLFLALPINLYCISSEKKKKEEVVINN